MVEKSQIKIDESEEYLNIYLDLRDGPFLYYEILADVVATNTKVIDSTLSNNTYSSVSYWGFTRELNKEFSLYSTLYYNLGPSV